MARRRPLPPDDDAAAGAARDEQEAGWGRFFFALAPNTAHPVGRRAEPPIPPRGLPKHRSPLSRAAIHKFPSAR